MGPLTREAAYIHQLPRFLRRFPLVYQGLGKHVNGCFLFSSFLVFDFCAQSL